MSNKLREALEVAKRTLCRWQADLPASAWVEVDATLLKIKSALAEPVRNRDVGTAEEQEKRFEKFCDKYMDLGLCVGCPFIDNDIDCKFLWSHMPYESVETKS